MQLNNVIAGLMEQPPLELAQSVCDASDGTPLFRQRAADMSQIDRALTAAAAYHAKGEWRLMPIEVRADILTSVADELDKRAAAIAEADSRCTGVIIELTRQVASICGASFRAAADYLRHPPERVDLEGPCGPLKVERLPLGPVAVIGPWNAPSGIICHKLASALAAGCPAIIKPSEWAPLSAQIIVEATHAAGLAPGLVQLLHGDGSVGAALIKDPRCTAVSFTGGLAGGRAVAAACAQGIKPAQLELGGNNAMVVLEDANVEHTAKAVLTGMVTLNGQWCRALGRLLVHESLFEPLMAAVIKRLEGVLIGPALNVTSQMGPLVHQGHLKHVANAVADYQRLGATLHAPSKLPKGKGNWFAPTLVTGLAPEQTREEIFGPVVAVHTFKTDEEAIALANGTDFGLAAYVFGEERRAWRASEQIMAGIVKINAVTMLNLNPRAPRPAWGLSGLGDEGIGESLEFFRGTRVIGVGARPGEK